MSDPYSALLQTFDLTDGDPDIVVTVPAGKVMIVRDVDAGSNADAGGSTLNLSDSAGNFFMQGRVSPLSSDVVNWRGRQVFRDDDSVTIHSEHGRWRGRMSGYLLDA